MMGYYGGWGMMGWWFASGLCVLVLTVALVAYFAWSARKPS